MVATAASVSSIISIHAPRGGSDATVRRPAKVDYHFNPRSPWGERLLVLR